MLLHEIFYQSLEKFPEKIAISSAEGECTYTQLLQEQTKIQNFLNEMNFGSDDKAFLILPNSHLFLSVHFAVLANGGVSVPLDDFSTPDFLAKVCQQVKVKIVFLTEANLRRLGPSGFFKESAVVVTESKSAVADFDPSWVSKIYLYSELQSLSPNQSQLSVTQKNAKQVPRKPSDLSTILFTSGSTGMPKGVCLSHQNTVHAIRNIARYLQYTSKDCEVITLPISHSFGLGHVYCNLLSGGRVHLERGLLRMGKVFSAIESLQATGFPGTPTGMGMILDRYSDLFKQKAKSLRFMVVNSSALPAQRAQQILSLMPETQLYVYYGLTEASRSSFAHLNSLPSDKLETVGKPIIEQVEIKILTDQGLTSAANQVGEICISGPTLTAGYWGQQDFSEKKLFEKKWLKTEDLGYLDQDGNLFLKGRLTEVINIGGYKVYPVEVENLLKQSGFFKDAAVVGIFNSQLNCEEVIAAVVIESESNSKDETFESRQEWFDYCVSRLEKFKVPSQFIVLDQIPKLESGKIKRLDLAELVKQKMENQ